LAALFGASLAGFGAGAAQLVVALGTLDTTLLAQLFTEVAEIERNTAVQAKQLGRSLAQSGALHGKLDAAGELLYVLLFGAGTGALVAQGGTAKTGFNAGLVQAGIHFHGRTVYRG